MSKTETKTPKQIHAERNASVEREFGELVGKTVKQVRALLPQEIEMFGWDYSYSGGGFYPWVIVFTDGTVAVPTCDPEGNDSGFMYIADLEK